MVLTSSDTVGMILCDEQKLKSFKSSTVVLRNRALVFKFFHGLSYIHFAEKCLNTQTHWRNIDRKDVLAADVHCTPQGPTIPVCLVARQETSALP